MFLLGSLFTLVVGWPLQIYVARKLGAQGLGIFSLLESVVAVVVGFLGLGLAPTLVRFIPEYVGRRQFAEIRQLVQLSVVLVMGLGLVGYLLVMAGRQYVSAIWPDLQGHNTAIGIMALLVPLTLLSFLLAQALRGFHEIRYLVLGSSVVQLVSKVVLAVCFLSLGLGLLGYIWAAVLSAAVGTLWMAVGLQRRITMLPASGAEGCPNVSFSEPAGYARVMYFSSLLGVGSGHLDRFLLGLFASASTIGILAVVRMLQQLPAVFMQTLVAVVAPMFAAESSRQDRSALRHLYCLSTDWLVRLSAPLMIFLLAFATPMLGLYGDEFAESGQWALIIVVVAQIVNLISGPVGNLLNMSGLEQPMFRLSLVSTAIQVSALLLLTPKFGLVGVATATAIGIVFLNLAALRLAKSRLGVGWADRRYLRWAAPILVSSGLAAFLRHAQPAPGVLALGFSLIGVYISFHGVSLAQGLHEDDRVLLSHWRAKLRRGFSRS